MVINKNKGDSSTNPITAAKKSAAGLTTLVYMIFWAKITIISCYGFKTYTKLEESLNNLNSYIPVKLIPKPAFVHSVTLSFLWH